MSDFQVLTAVRGHLLDKEVCTHVHLALPPKTQYPLILIELEEMWTSYPVIRRNARRDIQARLKFKVSVYSRSPGMEEAAQLSTNLRVVLEGITLRVPGEMAAQKSATLRFLACVSETSGNGQGGQSLRAIHHFYDCIVRG